MLDEDTEADDLIVDLPEVDRGDTALEVELAVRVEGVVRLDLHLAQAVRGLLPVGQRREVLRRERRAEAVHVAVEVARDERAVGLRVLDDLQRDVDRAQERVGQVRAEVDDVVEAGLDFRGRNTSEKVVNSFLGHSTVNCSEN